MNFADLLKMPTIDATAKMHFRLVMDLPILGKKELVELRLSGFRDEDGDMKPEFDCDFEVLDKNIIPVEHQRIELDPTLVTDALSGGADAVGALFQAVVTTLENLGIKLPF